MTARFRDRFFQRRYLSIQLHLIDRVENLLKFGRRLLAQFDQVTAFQDRLGSFRLDI